MSLNNIWLLQSQNYLFIYLFFLAESCVSRETVSTLYFVSAGFNLSFIATVRFEKLFSNISLLLTQVSNAPYQISKYVCICTVNKMSVLCLAQ